MIPIISNKIIAQCFITFHPQMHLQHHSGNPMIETFHFPIDFLGFMPKYPQISTLNSLNSHQIPDLNSALHGMGRVPQPLPALRATSGTTSLGPRAVCQSAATGTPSGITGSSRIILKLNSKGPYEASTMN